MGFSEFLGNITGSITTSTGSVPPAGGPGRGSRAGQNVVLPPVPVSFREHSYAMESPWYRPDASKPVRRSDSTPTGELRNLLNRSRQDDESAGVTRWAARVLRVENVQNENDGETNPFGWFDALSTTFDEEPHQPVSITALTDVDVHACAWGETGVGSKSFRLPSDGDPGSFEIIDKIRDGHKGLFIGVGNAPVPRVGELVWVSWADIANRRDGLYLGPVVPHDAALLEALRQKRHCPCNELNSESPNGLRSRGGNANALSALARRRRKASIDAKKERGEKPIGKGVFTGFPDLKTHKVKQATQATLNWVCYTGIKQGKEGELESADSDKAKKFSKEYHKKGIRTYIMGYPAYGHEEEFVAGLLALAKEASAIGVVLNLDHYYKGNRPESPYSQEKFLMEKLKELVAKSGFSIGLTATDIGSKKEVPWKKIFANPTTGVDFAIPQVLSQNFTSLRNNLIDKAEPASQPDPTVGQPTYFDDITPRNFSSIAKLFKPPEGYSSIEQFKEKWYSQGFDKRNDPNLTTRTLYLMGAAEIMEKYWKQIFPNCRVFISSHISGRSGGSGNHETGGAMDVRVELTPGGDRVPALHTWASLLKLQLAGRLPLGGTGLYLHVSPNGGMQNSIDPTKQGKATNPKAGPGGSANPHYDMRTFTYAPDVGGSNVQWKNLDTIPGDKGHDDIRDTAGSMKWLRRNKPNVSAYIKSGWQNNGNYTNGYLPAVPADVLNLKQFFGIESPPPPVPSTAAEDPFVTYFKQWKSLGFRYIIPGLGMVGNSPKPDGWRSDGYNTPEKSPWRMREDVIWTFTSVKKTLGNSMANSVIWWNWDGANVTNADWPEKRWHVIAELGDAVASAQKVVDVKKGSFNDRDKQRIISYQLGSFMKQSKSPPEKQDDKQKDKGKLQTKTPADSPPGGEKDPQEVPVPSGLSEAEKKELQDKVNALVKENTTKKQEVEKLEQDLKSAETTDESQKTKIIKEIASKNKIIAENKIKINKLRSKLGIASVVGTQNQKPSEVNCNTNCGYTQGATQGTGLITSGSLVGEKIMGMPITQMDPNPGYRQKPLKNSGFIIIHNPGSIGSTHDSLAAALRKDGNGVHFSVDRDGTVKQHTSLEMSVYHAKGVNESSYGIEVLANAGPRTLQGSPAKDFIVGPMKMYEATYQLVSKIAKNSPNFQMVFPDFRKKDATFYYGHNRLVRGVTAHASYVGARTDGKIEVLYMALRRVMKLKPQPAHRICVEMNEVAKKSAFKYDSSKSQPDGQGAGWIKVPGITAEPPDTGGSSMPCPEGQIATGTNADGTPICIEQTTG